MSEHTASRTVVVSNPQGLHARPADLIVKTAKKFAAKVELIKERERVDGRSILAILTLAAEVGTPITIEAHGADAEDAVAAIATIIAESFTDEDSMFHPPDKSNER